LYRNCNLDIMSRLNLCVEQIKLRLIENKVMQKKYPSVIKTLSRLEDVHKREVIKDLLLFYKVTHTI
jgi:hypothetical protein